MIDPSEIAREARAGTALSQRAFGLLIGTSHVSVARWETGAVEPKGSALALLRMIKADPLTAIEVLGDLRTTVEHEPGDVKPGAVEPPDALDGF